MSDDQRVTAWHDLGAKVLREMEGWRGEHPHATFAEIEAEVEGRLGTLRAALIQQEVDLRARNETASGNARVACEACAQELKPRGTRERAITVRGNGPVRLQRRYLACPACGAGLFPPG